MAFAAPQVPRDGSSGFSTCYDLLHSVGVNTHNGIPSPYTGNSGGMSPPDNWNDVIAKLKDARIWHIRAELDPPQSDHHYWAFPTLDALRGTGITAMVSSFTPYGSRYNNVPNLIVGHFGDGNTTIQTQHYFPNGNPMFDGYQSDYPTPQNFKGIPGSEGPGGPHDPLAKLIEYVFTGVIDCIQAPNEVDNPFASADVATCYPPLSSSDPTNPAVAAGFGGTSDVFNPYRRYIKDTHDYVRSNAWMNDIVPLAICSLTEGTLSGLAMGNTRAAWTNTSWANKADWVSLQTGDGGSNGVSAYVDLGDLHPYTGNNCPSMDGNLENPGNLPTARNYVGPQVSSKMMIVSEMGFTDAPGGDPTMGGAYPNLAALNAAGNGNHNVWGALPDDVKTKYVLKMYLTYYLWGIRRTYYYSFIDEFPDDTNQYLYGAGLEAFFGLLHFDHTPKPAYYALRNFQAINDDVPIASPVSKTPTLTGFTAGAADPESGAAEQLHSLTLQRSNNTYIVYLWRTHRLWNRAQLQRVHYTPQFIVVGMSGMTACEYMIVDDVTRSWAPLTVTSASAKVAVGEDVVALHVTFTPPPSPNTPPRQRQLVRQKLRLENIDHSNRLFTVKGSVDPTIDGSFCYDAPHLSWRIREAIWDGGVQTADRNLASALRALGLFDETAGAP